MPPYSWAGRPLGRAPLPRADRPRPAPPIEFHVVGCDCLECNPYAPSIVPALRGREIAALLAAGFLTATEIALLVDRAGTVAILVDLVRWWFA